MAGAFTMTMIQQLIPDAVRGRAFGALMSLMGGVVPIGTVLAGFLVTLVGVHGMFWIAGTGCATGAIILAITFARIPFDESSNQSMVEEKANGN